MKTITGAELLISQFECMPPGSNLEREEVLQMVVDLGGDKDAAARCPWDSSLLAYVLALITRSIADQQPGGKTS